MLNSAVVYRAHTGKKITELEFRQKLIDEILKYAGPARRTTSQRPSLSRSDHELVTNSPGKKGIPKYRVCKECSDTVQRSVSRKRTESKYKCSVCKVTLCPGCFSSYHKKLD